MTEVLIPAIESALHFGPFRLLRSQKLLLEEDKPLRLGSRAFDILTVLAERAGDIVSKDDLIAHAWPDTIVEENSLRVHIAALRRTLGDGQEGLRYIANVPGRGYCFVAPVFRPSARVAAGGSLTAPERPNHNLPVRLTRMIGRSQVVESLAAALPRHRFVSVVGPGGMGKTTLALAVAEDTLASYADGVRFVDLALVADPQLVPTALAAALDVSVAIDDPVSGLVSHLQDKRLLIVLDNCEHVIEAAAALAVRVLKAAPGIHLLATSREPLRGEGERVVRLASLAAPPDSIHLTATAALGYPAVQLFVERAVATQDSFELTDADAPLAAELCRRLDGLPLAIELAAARVGFFGIRELVARLDDRFRLLNSGRRTVLARHQTLRALLDWSYELLSDSERVTLRRLAVFKGSFTLESAEAVAVDSTFGTVDVLGDLTALAAKSLVTVDVNDEVTRYRLLDTTRTYALEKLVRSDEGPKICRRHAEHLCELLGATDVDAPATVRSQWLATYGRLIDEVRAALDWAFSLAGDPALGVRLTEASTSLAYQLSLLDEYRVRVERALVDIASLETPQPLVELRLQVALGAFAGQTRGAHEVARCAFRRAFELAEQTGRTQHRIESLFGLWVGAFASGEYDESLRLAEAMAAAAKTDADAVAMLITDRMTAQSQHCLGHHQVARDFAGRVLDRSLEQLQFVKSKLPSVDRRVSMRIILARIQWIEGHPEQAVRTAREAFEFALSDVAFGICHALAWAACPVALWTGDVDAARCLTQTLREESTKYALDYWQSWARNYERVLSHQVPLVSPPDPKQVDMFGTLVASQVGAASVERVEKGKVGWCAPEILRAHGENLKARGAGASEVEPLFQRSLELARRQGALSWELRTATSLGRLWQEHGRVAPARDLLGSVRARFTEGFATADLRAADALLAQWAPLRSVQ
ncbi:winged helix-turn-helix domain-containing protein [Variovorax sp. J22R24]|uniref:ATP-binding protein n=1 Tax=Variovorax gracilis TaxID=3053502 RepID=UPI0025779DFF|nr:winged helix-turn-helix domain-containing protein [Variovorax sp. J22R24]MDM0104476.1 winged helix-turn-helix domain-containing protein [Variovorax sp. J22R24]